MCGVCMKCPGANHPGWCWAGLGWAGQGHGARCGDIDSMTYNCPGSRHIHNHGAMLSSGCQSHAQTIIQKAGVFIKLFMRILHIQYLDTILHYYQHKDCNNVVITTSLQTTIL